MTARYEVEASDIKRLVYDLALTANRILPEGLKKIIETSAEKETKELPKQAFRDILKNAELAAEKGMPICQDCGLAVVFVEAGQDVSVVNGGFEDAINKGVRRAYLDGYLRKSVVEDPLFNRKNTGDNTPAVIHWKIVPGHDIRITVSPKGMGSENMSKIYMLKPADGAEGVINAVVETVKNAGPNPCPPIVLGIGIGGNFETVALAAKSALLKKEGERNPLPEYAEMERDILARVNALGIGPGGYGGNVTALDAHIVQQPTHIAGMPVAVNICCHALRHAEGTKKGRKCNG
ncbi:MAG: fumarate hydratase [Synergistaceae bacterium]|nr:fumarate hydratase [Synergistaceae bacterium]